MTKIAKLKLHNFKRFKDLTIILDSKMNILIGDNESGKSSILQAIDLVARGSRHRIEEIGLERLFNVEATSTLSHINLLTNTRTKALDNSISYCVPPVI